VSAFVGAYLLASAFVGFRRLSADRIGRAGALGMPACCMSVRVLSSASDWRSERAEANDAAVSKLCEGLEMLGELEEVLSADDNAGHAFRAAAAYVREWITALERDSARLHAAIHQLERETSA
jgi:hypothetical protein